MKPKRKIKFKVNKKKVSYTYVIGITFLTFVIAVILQGLSNLITGNIPALYAFIILAAVILIGVLFDIIGVAVTSSDIAPFLSMASDKIKGAKESIMLIKNAEKVSNIANDVVGDVCGIVSGGIGASLILILSSGMDSKAVILISVMVTGFVSALTVGGKALGKFAAISYNNQIVYFAGKVIAFFKFKNRG